MLFSMFTGDYTCYTAAECPSFKMYARDGRRPHQYCSPMFKCLKRGFRYDPIEWRIVEMSKINNGKGMLEV